MLASHRTLSRFHAEKIQTLFGGLRKVFVALRKLIAVKSGARRGPDGEEVH